MTNASFAGAAVLVTTLCASTNGFAQLPPPPPPATAQPATAQPATAHPARTQQVQAPPRYYPPPAYPYPPPAYYAPQPAYQRPRTSEMDPNDPPPGYHTESRARSGLVVGGSVLLGIAYVLSASWAGAALGDRNDDLVPLFVPVVGPFMTISTARVFQSKSGDDEAAAKAVGGAFLIVDGIVQVAGMTMLVVGLTARKDVVVRDRKEAPSAAPEVAVGPGSVRATWQF